MVGVIIGKYNNTLSAFDLLKGMIMTQALYLRVWNCHKQSDDFTLFPVRVDKINCSGGEV